MLDDLAVLELENVHDGIAARAGRWNVMDVQDDVIAICKNPFDVTVIIGKFLAQEGEKSFQTFRPVGSARIVLDIARPKELRRCFKILLIDCRSRIPRTAFLFSSICLASAASAAGAYAMLRRRGAAGA